MKKLIGAFLLLLFAVWLGFLIHRDPGYILITYHSWSIETSLWVGIVILLVGFIAFYLLLRLFRHTSQLGVSLQTWHKERRERKAGELTNQAFNELIEMQWDRAERLFSKSAQDSTCPVINYSAAAYAAQQLSAFERRNTYLIRLSKHVKSASKTTKLIESYFYIHSKQWNEALVLLHALRKKYPHNPAVIRFLTNTLTSLKDWESLKELIPSIEKNVDSVEFKKLTSDIYSALLNKATQPKYLDQTWETVPKLQRTHPVVVNTYAMKAIELSCSHKAVSIVENAIKKNWDRSLVSCYGKLKSEQTNKQISHAESWLKKHPDDPTLLICLGRLCIDEKLWGKARDYLHKAITITATSEGYSELGRLFDATDEPKAALDNYRKALSTY